MMTFDALGEKQSFKEQLVGAWMLLSWEQKSGDGTKVERYGTSPKGIWNGTDQKRFVAIAGDQLTLTIHPPDGDVVDVNWTR